MTSADPLANTPGMVPGATVLARYAPRAAAVVGRWWDVRVEGIGAVPGEGPAILAANHIGLLDGPLLAMFAPRATHVLTKQEMFRGRTGRVLRAAGQIPVDRDGADVGAVRSCVRVLRAGGVVGIFPEGHRGAGEFDLYRFGAAYLALVTGAPVVPVTFFGTRVRGGAKNSLPPRRTRIDIVYGEPWRTTPQEWPRTREQVRTTSTLLKQHLRGELQRARDLTGRDLPGPIPDPESDNNPLAGSKRGTP